MIEIITSVIGTLAFSVLLRVPPKHLFFTTMGGFLSATIFTLLYDYATGTFGATLLAMISICIYSEIFARVLHTPATVLLLPSAIPLLPGSSIYYAMSYIVHYDKKQFVFYASETIKAGIGMGLGAVIVGVFVNMLVENINKKIDKNISI